MLSERQRLAIFRAASLAYLEAANALIEWMSANPGKPNDELMKNEKRARLNLEKWT